MDPPPPPPPQTPHHLAVIMVDAQSRFSHTTISSTLRFPRFHGNTDELSISARGATTYIEQGRAGSGGEEGGGEGLVRGDVWRGEGLVVGKQHAYTEARLPLCWHLAHQTYQPAYVMGP